MATTNRHFTSATVIPVVTFLGGAALGLRKDEIESNEKSHEYKAGVVAGKLAQKGITIARGQNPYVKNLKLSHALDQFIRPDKLGGLRFLYGPQGSGKSTHIREYVSQHVNKGGHGVVSWKRCSNS